MQTRLTIRCKNSVGVPFYVLGEHGFACFVHHIISIARYCPNRPDTTIQPRMCTLRSVGIYMIEG